jgi:hypothetical protein
LSVLTYTYLYSLQIFPDVFTPHVLSEWMVEVCGAYLYRFWFMFMFLSWWMVVEGLSV